MSPEQLARSNTESGHQKAIFAWANMARRYGFDFANDMNSYTHEAVEALLNNGTVTRVPALTWLHAIPNGGARDIVTAARMKAEGVKPGMPDIFLPFPRLQLDVTGVWITRHCGLYVELKKLGKIKTISKDQELFGAYCREVGYAHEFCEGWRAAADVIQRYLTE